jgi:Ni/Fe-hydrogenase subunit HybB-like protein
MSADQTKSMGFGSKFPILLSIIFILVGGAAFVAGLSGPHPERAWHAYLINFLLWSGIAQGALVFSAVMQVTKAKWHGPLGGLAECFSAFFPISFALFLLLFLGRSYIFPWLHEDLQGKEVWLNLPFLFWRDCIGLVILYLLGLAYTYRALQLKFKADGPRRGLRRMLGERLALVRKEPAQIKRHMTIIGGWYVLIYAVVVSLLGYDLIMSMQPHWVSTLFGGYIFIKAFYLGLGGLIILAAIIYLRRGAASGLTPAHFHDLGKLYFAFCLLWADFFYVQLLVIWYGNIPEETHYVIERVMFAPWKYLSWTVFAVGFLGPFVILLNRWVKTKPVLMMLLCSLIIVGLWLEHLLLLGPAWNHGARALPLDASEGLITLGFLGLMIAALIAFLRTFPEVVLVRTGNP